MNFDPSLNTGTEESMMISIQPTIAVSYEGWKEDYSGINKENSCDQ